MTSNMTDAVLTGEHMPNVVMEVPLVKVNMCWHMQMTGCACTHLLQAVGVAVCPVQLHVKVSGSVATRLVCLLHAETH